jgi:hypothetical protein
MSVNTSVHNVNGKPLSTNLASALRDGRLVDKRYWLILGLHVNPNVIGGGPISLIYS